MRAAQAAWALLALVPAAQAQTAPPPAFEFSRFFEYRIENVVVHTTLPGTWNVKVIFSVANPVNGGYWLIKNDAPYVGAGANLGIDIGWDPATDFGNTGSSNAALTPVSTTALGVAAAAPVTWRNLNAVASPATPCTAASCPGIPEATGRYFVERTVTPVGFRSPVRFGRVAIEGRPVCSGLTGCPTSTPPYAVIPVRAQVADFAFVANAIPTSAMVDRQRRPVVDFDAKCANCHDGRTLDGAGVAIPRLNMHGSNRTENTQLCVMCHNANQTDVAYRAVTADARTSTAEVSIDFKRMVHAIHAGRFRSSPYVVVGFNSLVRDYSGVRFPREISNCLNCHVEVNGRGTFELPLQSSVLGSTVVTGSVFAVPVGATRTIDVDPSNDLKISPTAATCSGCHDGAKVASHMVRTGGASFSTQQRNIGLSVKERCASCHGPGKKEDVRRVHEIGSSGGSSGGSGDDSREGSRHHRDSREHRRGD
jgi:OmcA/MtrC family decaheme c-type cytochrome